MKALPMPSGQDEGTANFPYQILLVKFHLQYRNDQFLIVEQWGIECHMSIPKNVWNLPSSGGM